MAGAHESAARVRSPASLAAHCRRAGVDPPGVLLLVSSAAIPRRPCRCAAILTAEWLAPRWGKLRSARRGLQRSPRSPEHHHEAEPVLLEVAARVFLVDAVQASGLGAAGAGFGGVIHEQQHAARL